MEKQEPIHYFTLDEVNLLIPRMEEYFQNFWSYRQKAQDILHQLRKVMKDPSYLNPSQVARQQIRQSQAHFLLHQAQNELDEILEIGGVIKDLEIGLVDFCHILEPEDEEVYLCWKYGEKRVRFWHKVHEGYTSRRPLARRTH